MKKIFLLPVYKILMILIPFVFIVACNNEKKLPKDIMKQDKMREVMLDVLLAETYVQDQMFSQDTAKTRALELYTKVLAKHNISMREYQKSLNFYTRHPDLYGEVLQPIIDSLSSMEARY